MDIKLTNSQETIIVICQRHTADLNEVIIVKVRNMVLEDKSTATQCWVGGKDELYTMVRNGMKPAILDEDIYTICSPN